MPSEAPPRRNKSSDAISSSPERIAADRLLQRLQQERKYFDSGDYALSKSGSASSLTGQLHPSPEALPHRSIGSISHSPMKDVCSAENLASVDWEDVAGGRVDAEGVAGKTIDRAAANGEEASEEDTVVVIQQQQNEDANAFCTAVRSK